METLTELRQLRRCARCAHAIIKRSHGSGGDGEFVLIAMNAEREINQVLNVYDLLAQALHDDELQYDGN